MEINQDTYAQDIKEIKDMLKEISQTMSTIIMLLHDAISALSDLT